MSEYKNIKVNKLRKASWNYKGNDADLAQKLKENLKQNGQIENLIVRELGDGTFEVVNGNHRYDSLVELGIKEAMCCNMGEISDSRAKKLAVVTNETKFPVDATKLAVLIKEISEDTLIEDLVTTMPFTLDELEYFMDADISDLLDDDIELPEIPNDSSGNVTTSSKHITCPSCGHTFGDD